MSRLTTNGDEAMWRTMTGCAAITIRIGWFFLVLATVAKVWGWF